MDLLEEQINSHFFKGVQSPQTLKYGHYLGQATSITLKKTKLNRILAEENKHSEIRAKVKVQNLLRLRANLNDFVLYLSCAYIVYQLEGHLD